MILIQKSFGRGQTEFELADAKVIVRNRKGTQRTETNINYASLLAEYDSRASSDRRYPVACAVLMVLVVSFFFGAWNTKDSAMAFVLIVAGIIMLGFALLVLRYYFVSCFDLVVFFYRNGAFAFSISRDKPDREKFSSFIENLVRRITHAENEAVNANTSGLAGELEKLGRLRDKNLLTDEEFSKAKESLLAQIERGSRSVGFHQE